jgi:hypothetical protein
MGHANTVTNERIYGSTASTDWDVVIVRVKVEMCI